MQKNETRIKGDKNSVLQGIRNSRIRVQNDNKYNPNKNSLTFWGIIIALLGLVAAIIIGWDSIIKFFEK